MHHTGGIITLALLLSQPAAALCHERADSAEIHFHQGKSVMVPGYKGNGAHLDSLINRIESAPQTDALHRYSVSRVAVTAGASPEGPVELNRRLSERRAASIFDYVTAHTALPDSLTSFTFLGRDWRGLRTLVEADPEVPFREETLALLDAIIADWGARGSLARLKALRGGVPYRYMYGRLFPALRESRLTVEYAATPRPAPVTLPALSLTCAAPALPALALPAIAAPRDARNHYMALKTNLLHDVLALPSISAELYLGKNYSAVINWTYGWWDTDRTHHYWRAYGGDLAVRRWFGRKAEEKPLTGHHVGLYAGVLTYDFELGGKGYMGGLPHHTLWDRCLLNAGVEYGYSLPISRRLNLDFTIGLGYLGGRYVTYEPVNKGYLWESTRRLHWIGPTKAEVALTWLIGHGNYNRKKGGRL